jgi:polysaccharide export outer membrane protein
MVALPLLGEVPVAGLTLAEVKAQLTVLLGRDYLVNPQVDVRVKEYQSQFVTVLGEVSTPGRRPLRGGQTRLIDVLVEAGGLTPRASGELVLSRADGTFEGGARTMRVQLGAPNLTPEEERRLRLPLRAGDIITAAPKYYVTVEGEVMRPGRYVLDTALTVSGAISAAGGLTRFGRQRVQVRRIDGPSGRVQIFDVDLKAVRKGEKPDPPLQANDTISVSRRIL